jgi:GNAT superfamily N-acetyltransferase
MTFKLSIYCALIAFTPTTHYAMSQIICTDPTNQKDVGYIFYRHLYDTTWEINDLHVDRDYRKKGIGTWLVYNCYQTIKEFQPDCSKIRVNLMPTDPYGPNLSELLTFFKRTLAKTNPLSIWRIKAYHEAKNIYLNTISIDICVWSEQSLSSSINKISLY